MIGVTVSLLRTALQDESDVVHVVTAGQLGLARDLAILTMCKVLNKPSVYHIRFGRIPDLAKDKRSIEWRVLKTCTNLADVVIVLDARSKEKLTPFCERKRLRLIPNFVDSSQIPTRAAEMNHIVFVGWVVAEKGIEELLEAWQALAMKEWSLRLVGPCEREYEQFLRSRFDTTRVAFLGQKARSEALDEMSRAAVLVLPSYTEGFPNVVVEAMSLGVAVICTRVGALPEMLGERYELFVNVRDAADLAKVLQRALNDDDLRTAVGISIKRRVDRYSISNVVAQYAECWHQLNSQGA